MEGTATSDIVVGIAAPIAAAPDALMDQAPGLVAADSGPKQSKAPKRAAADAMSPGHLASTTALAPEERRLQHAYLGVDKDFRDAVKTERSTLKLTKDVLEL